VDSRLANVVRGEKEGRKGKGIGVRVSNAIRISAEPKRCDRWFLVVSIVEGRRKEGGKGGGGEKEGVWDHFAVALANAAPLAACPTAPS